MQSRLLLAGCAALLLGAVAWQLRPALQREVHPLPRPLGALLPAGVPGWTVQDDPVADTAEMKRAVAEVLNYNEAIVRTYRRGAQSISVYVAYWQPGRMHPRLIAQHTPDECWVDAGWEMLGADGETSLALAENRHTWPGQTRVFRKDGSTLHVTYWHLHGGRPSGYAQGNGSKRIEFYSTFLEDLTAPPHEQYFIRLSSTEPIERLADEPLLQQLLGVLGTLGLAADR